MRSRILLFLLAALVAVGSSACAQRAEPTGELAAAFPVTVQGAGEEPVELAEAPQRVVALDPGSAELVAALDDAGRLVGAPAGVRVATGKRPAVVVRPNGQLDVDAVVALDPDLIVTTPDIDRVDVAKIEERTEAPVYVQPGRSVEDVQRAALELGFLLGRPVAARQLVASLKESVAAVDARIADAAEVSTFVDTGFGITVSDSSLLGSLVTRARGINVAGDYAGLGPYPLARLRAKDPDVYLTTSDSEVTLDTLRAQPGTRALRAVEAGDVVVVPSELVTRAGPRIAEGYEAVAAALHPDAFR